MQSFDGIHPIFPSEFWSVNLTEGAKKKKDLADGVATCRGYRNTSPTGWSAAKHVRIAGWKPGTARALGTRHMPGLVGEVACRHLSR